MLQRLKNFLLPVSFVFAATSCIEYTFEKGADEPTDTGTTDVDAEVEQITTCEFYNTVGQISSPGLGWSETNICTLSSGNPVGSVGSKTMTSVFVSAVDSPVPPGDVRLVAQTDDGSPAYPDSSNLRTSNGESAGYDPSDPSAGWYLDTSYLGDMNGCYPTCNWVEIVLEIQDQTTADAATCSSYIPTNDSVQVCLEWERAIAARSAPVDSQCTAGSGRFRLLPREIINYDGDTDWSIVMTPIQTSGTGALTGHAWITSLDVVEDQGQTLRILKPVSGFEFTRSDDQLAQPNVVSFPINPTNSWTSGVISGNAPIVGLEIPSTTTNNLELDLEWECGTVAIPQERTPPQGYLVDPDAIDCLGDIPQIFTVRPVPAISPTKLIVERYGYSDDRHAIPLTTTNGIHSFNHRRGDFHVKGSISSLTANGAVLALDKVEQNGIPLCIPGTHTILPEG